MLPVTVRRVFLAEYRVDFRNRGERILTDFQRNGASNPYQCARYFIVNDYLPKPCLLLYSSGKIVGAAQYDPFGHVNRQFMEAETAHPYSNNTIEAPFSQGPSTCDPKVYNVSNLRWRTRVGYHSFDTEAANDVVRYKSSAGTVLGSASGTNYWPYWSEWMAPTPIDRKVNLTFSSNGTVTRQGVNTQYCEYRVHDSTIANPFWIPLRFPGQYFDEETDLFENWNRYYDPWTGRYLQPEPLLADPAAFGPRHNAHYGFQAYTYSASNPLTFADPTGLAGSEAEVDYEQNKFRGICKRELGARYTVVDCIDRACAVTTGPPANPTAALRATELYASCVLWPELFHRTRQECKDLAIAQANRDYQDCVGRVCKP